MKLTKLELYGFKSFAKKTEILFDSGITAIVGPNGSGKSNIADAIRWVLGEQSAKTLRGSRMEDVIFGGTAQRKAMSYCEVTLTFDNSDGLLPLDYAEVSITRRVYRSGDSEYCINKTTCRLRDILELFRDTGLGKEGYSIVGQGKVEEILSNKSGERRKAFEEAAGIMKYRVRKEEAERSLDNTRKNLTRLSDIIAEIEERIEPLSEQAETAEKFLRLRDELRELDINLFLHQYDKVKERIAGIDDVLSQIAEEQESLDRLRTELAQICSETEEKERAVTEKLTEKNNELVSKTAGLEEKIGDLKVADEKIQGADREHAALKARIDENTKRRDELSAHLSAQNDKSKERDAILEKLRAEFADAQNALKEASDRAIAKEQEVEDLKTAMFEAANRLGDTKSNISRLTATLESLQERISAVTDESTDISSEEQTLKDELSEAEEELEKAEKLYKEQTDARNAAMEEANENAFLIKENEEKIHKAEQFSENKKARLNALIDMKKAHDGYYSSIQKLLNDAQSNPILRSEIEGTVAEIIKVPGEYEIAIEMAMGATLQNIVTPDEQSAKDVVRYLRENRYGRATLLPVTNMRSRKVTQDELYKMKRVPGYIGIASELIEFAERHRGVAENLLGRTVIVDNLDTGTEINRITGQSMRIATLDGDIINPGGSITGGSTNKSLNLLGRERECAELLGEIDKVKKLYAALISKRSSLSEREKALSLKLAEISDVCHTQEIELAKQRDKQDIIKSQLDKVLHRSEQQEQEKARILENIEDIKQALSDAEAQKESLSSGSTATQKDIIAAQGELSMLRHEQEEKAAAETDLKVRIATLEKEADALSGEHARMEKEMLALSESIAADTRREVNFSEEQFGLLQRKAELETEIQEKRNQNGELSAECKQLEEQRSALLSELDEKRRNKQEQDDKADELRERKHRQEMSRTRSENELATMQDRMWADYELTYENALMYKKPIPITSSTQRATELKRAIRELGDININAIEEFRTLNERYTNLTTQVDDLKAAENDLCTLIDELIRTMENSFREKFAQICQNFKKVFTELFGGGTAELILSDEKDILNCDIDILAQIPGKKLQSLSPLSGGERALTAIALQFAILGLKPTAFCLLDEIDASLDEINVSRFAEYVHSYANDTQFILITHRKGSMEACNSIYGVAQEEKGLSKVVSARLVNSEES